MTHGGWNDLDMITDYDGNIWCTEHADDWSMPPIVSPPLYEGGETGKPFTLIDLKIAIIKHMQQWHKGGTL